MGAVTKRECKQVVRTQVIAVHITFMLTPIFLTIVCFTGVLLARHAMTSELPRNIWQMMAMAKELPCIPQQRDESKTNFPDCDDKLGLCFFDALETPEGQGVYGKRRRISLGVRPLDMTKHGINFSDIPPETPIEESGSDIEEKA